MAKMEISSNMEDYLEAISEIIDSNGHAHTKDIAARMGVKMPSVTNALQALASRGLIHYQSHAPVVLTTDGENAANEIRRRHVELRRFFCDILKLDENEADAVACKMEHGMSDQLIARFIELVESISSREDCAGLRAHLAEAMPQIGGDPDGGLIPLSNLTIGQSGTIRRVAESLRGVRRFADLGLVSGATVVMEGNAPFGDLLRIKLLGSSLSLRASDAAYILIKPIE